MLSVPPCQSDYFLKIDDSKSVQPTWFLKELPDKTVQRRIWLSFSISLKTLFCTTCIAFGGLTSSVWTSQGCSNWTNITRDIIRHETSSAHLTAEIVRIQWLSKRRLIDSFSLQQVKFNEQIERNRNVVRVMIDTVRFLAKEHMALIGHDSSDGKFTNLFTLLAKYDSAAASYLQMLEDHDEDKLECNLLSPGNQKRLLSCMKKNDSGRNYSCDCFTESIFPNI